MRKFYLECFCILRGVRFCSVVIFTRTSKISGFLFVLKFMPFKIKESNEMNEIIADGLQKNSERDSLFSRTEFMLNCSSAQEDAAFVDAVSMIQPDSRMTDIGFSASNIIHSYSHKSYFRFFTPLTGKLLLIFEHKITINSKSFTSSFFQ